jgi:hypothetical protein
MNTATTNTAPGAEKVHGGAALNDLAQGKTLLSEAREMLSLFASVGTHHFDVTLKDDRAKKGSLDRGRTVRGLTLSLPELLSLSEREKKSIIIRPRAKTPLIQLDDLNAEAIEKVRDLSFIIIETSRGNFQAWVSVTDAGEDTARALKEATGADLNASGAVRVCGSRNYKPEHGPDFPSVRLIEGRPGRTTTTAELLDRGLLPPPPPALDSVQKHSHRHTPPRAPSRDYESSTWPDYGECLAHARKENGEADASRADSRFAWIAARRGFSLDAIAAKLLEVSEKVKRIQSEAAARKYAERTARRAFESAQNSSSSHRQR